MQTTYERQEYLDEGSSLVKTIFFKQQVNHERVRKQQLDAAEQSLAEAKSDALVLQQQHFQEQYLRLRGICNKIKEGAQANVKAIPVLADPQFEEATLNSFTVVSKLTSATDNFLEEVVKYSRSHVDDITAFKNLTEDLAVTSDLLTSPTAQNMSAFQQRVNVAPKYQNDANVSETMIKVGEIFYGAAVAIMIAAIIAMPFVALAIGGGIFLAGMGLAVVGAFSWSMGKNFKLFAQTAEHPIESHKRAIADEIKQQNYVELTSGLR